MRYAQSFYVWLVVRNANVLLQLAYGLRRGKIDSLRWNADHMDGMRSQNTVSMSALAALRGKHLTSRQASIPMSCNDT